MTTKLFYSFTLCCFDRSYASSSLASLLSDFKLAATSVASSDRSNARSFLKGRGMLVKLTITSGSASGLTTRTSNVPLRGRTLGVSFQPGFITMSNDAPSASLETNPFSFSALRLKTPQLLHASISTTTPPGVIFAAFGAAALLLARFVEAVFFLVVALRFLGIFT